MNKKLISIFTIGALLIAAAIFFTLSGCGQKSADTDMYYYTGARENENHVYKVSEAGTQAISWDSKLEIHGLAYDDGVLCAAVGSGTCLDGYDIYVYDFEKDYWNLLSGAKSYYPDTLMVYDGYIYFLTTGEIDPYGYPIARISPDGTDMEVLPARQNISYGMFSIDSGILYSLSDEAGGTGLYLNAYSISKGKTESIQIYRDDNDAGAKLRITGSTMYQIVPENALFEGGGAQVLKCELSTRWGLLPKTLEFTDYFDSDDLEKSANSLAVYGENIIYSTSQNDLRVYDGEEDYTWGQRPEGCTIDSSYYVYFFYESGFAAVLNTYDFTEAQVVYWK